MRLKDWICNTLANVHAFSPFHSICICICICILSVFVSIFVSVFKSVFVSQDIQNYFALAFWSWVSVEPSYLCLYLYPYLYLHLNLYLYRNIFQYFEAGCQLSLLPPVQFAPSGTHAISKQDKTVKHIQQQKHIQNMGQTHAMHMDLFGRAWLRTLCLWL